MAENQLLCERFRLDGVAIVTGASSGIGAHITTLLASQGMTVFAAARRLDRLESLAGEDSRIIPFRCDVGCDDDLRALASAAAERGPITVLVNNAGISDAVIRAEDQDPAQFRNVVDINLNATFVLSAAVAKFVIASGGTCSMVNIASIHGLVAGAPNAQAAYVASKAGVVGLTRELAGQWARNGINVNAIAPGPFLTEMLADLAAQSAGFLEYSEGATMPTRRTDRARWAGPAALLPSGVLHHRADDPGGWRLDSAVTSTTRRAAGRCV